MPKVIGTRERLHLAFYESLKAEVPRTRAARPMGAYRTPLHECRNCGAPREAEHTRCAYCDTQYRRD